MQHTPRRWADVRPLPGARRLLEHLASCGVRVAVATSTSRATFDSKLSKKPWMRELFQAAVCGDEVRAWRLGRRCHWRALPAQQLPR
jgi:riboflavin kinase